jgi:hypothetical protein
MPRNGTDDYSIDDLRSETVDFSNPALPPYER